MEKGVRSLSSTDNQRLSALTQLVKIALASLLQLVGISDLGAQSPLGEEEPTREDKGERGGVWVAPSSWRSGQVAALEKEG